MKFVAVAAILLFAPQENNEAEDLFRKMESRIEEAKTLTVSVKGVMSRGPADIDIKSDLLLGDKNRARFEFTMMQGGRSVSAEAVSDGQSVGGITTDGKSPPRFKAPEKFGRMLRLRLSRAGVVAAVEAMQLERNAKEDPDDSVKVSELALGKKESMQDREVQQITYKMSKKGEPDRQASIWIDLATHLPLKRELKLETTSLTEEYTKFELDGKVDPAKFELPK